MIRCIAAIDTNQGIANEQGIPWLGKLPTDVKYYREHTQSQDVVMGYGLYKELNFVWSKGHNYVATKGVHEAPRPGYIFIDDARKLLQEATGDIWNLGGALLFASTLDLADELYITQLDQDFYCTKFFPPFKDDFTLQSESQPVTENGVTYTFQVWVRK